MRLEKKKRKEIYTKKGLKNRGWAFKKWLKRFLQSFSGKTWTKSP